MFRKGTINTLFPEKNDHFNEIFRKVRARIKNPIGAPPIEGLQKKSSMHFKKFENLSSCYCLVLLAVIYNINANPNNIFLVNHETESITNQM